MGFRLNRTYVLDFSDTALEGAVIKIRSTTIGTVTRLRAADSATDLAALLAEHVSEWNLEDEKGEPLPITAEAICGELEEAMLAMVCREWYKAAVGVTAPLDGSSNSGEPSPAPSIPMDD